MPKLFVFKLSTALIHKTAQNRPQNAKNMLPSGEVKWKWRRWCTSHSSDSAQSGPCDDSHLTCILRQFDWTDVESNKRMDIEVLGIEYDNMNAARTDVIDMAVASFRAFNSFDTYCWLGHLTCNNRSEMGR